MWELQGQHRKVFRGVCSELPPWRSARRAHTSLGQLRDSHTHPWGDAEAELRDTSHIPGGDAGTVTRPSRRCRQSPGTVTRPLGSGALPCVSTWGRCWCQGTFGVAIILDKMKYGPWIPRTYGITEKENGVNKGNYSNNYPWHTTPSQPSITQIEWKYF